MLRRHSGRPTLRLEEKAQPATINRELAALRAAHRLGLDHDTIIAMPRIRLLLENNAIFRHLSTNLADAVQSIFITGWRSRSEVLPLRWPQVVLAGGFVRLEPGTTTNGEGRAFPLIPELRALLQRRQAITRRCERARDGSSLTRSTATEPDQVPPPGLESGAPGIFARRDNSVTVRRGRSLNG